MGMNEDILKSAGVDFELGLRRFMGNRQIYEDVLRSFPTDPVFGRLTQAYADRDYKTLFASIHEIKGTSGNVGMTELYYAACELTELLRGGDYVVPMIDTAYARVKAAIDAALDGIRAAGEQ